MRRAGRAPLTASAPHVPERIVSGGQTGVDRAALDVARELGIATGGWVPRGRRAEDGRVPERYAGLVETDSEDYARRTDLNVRDADATLVLCFGRPSGGTALTVRRARARRRPLLVLDLQGETPEDAAAALRAWLERERPGVLNVAGPRSSSAPRIAEAATEVLLAVLGASG